MAPSDEIDAYIGAYLDAENERAAEDMPLPGDHDYGRIITPEPALPDVFQARADQDDVTRPEAKRRTLTEVYGGDPMLIRGELLTPEPLATELREGMISRNMIEGYSVDGGPVFPELQRESIDAPRTLRDILFTHRALAGASALETTELMGEVERWVQGGPSHQHCASACAPFLGSIVADARRQRDNARGQDVLFRDQHGMEPGGIGQREAQWIRANPGLVALLKAVDDA